MIRRYRPTAPYRHHGRLRVVLYLDDETYEAADRIAHWNDINLSSQLAVLIELGLLEAEKDIVDV
jgi:hypothetical protein